MVSGVPPVNEYLYGGTPPLISNVMVPSLPSKQVTSVLLISKREIAVGPVIVKDRVTGVQPSSILPSYTYTV